MKEKAFLICTLFVCCFGLLNAQLLLYEDLTNYNVDAKLQGQGSWRTNTSANLQLWVKNSIPLTFENYNGGGSKNAYMPAPNDTISRVYNSFTHPETTKQFIYFSFLINLTDATTTGEKFISLADGSNYFAYVAAKRNGDFYYLGISKYNVFGIPEYGTGALNFNQTYLIVVKYEIIATDLNDKMDLWVNPQLTFEPSDETKYKSVTTSFVEGSINQVTRFYWHNLTSGNSPTGYFDAIRIAVGATSAEAWSNLKALRTAAYNNLDGGNLYQAPQCTATGNDQPVGRFKLTTDNTGALLDDVSIKLNLTSGNSSSIKSIKLWKSANDSFESGSDTMIASTNTYDTTIIFENLASEVLQGDSYYFVTLDLENATGQINPQLSAISLSNGAITNFTPDSDLSDSDSQTLPVTLSSFTALNVSSGSVMLKWTTQSETNLIGYHVFRSENNQLVQANRISDRYIQACNQSTETHYQFKDEHLLDSQSFYYWLASYELDGTINYHGPVMVNSFQEEIIPPVLVSETCLHPAYPNPANPSSMISFDLSEESHVNISIYNIKGQFITKLTDQIYPKGKFNLIWNAKDQHGKKCTTGVYLYKMNSKNYQSIKKLMIIK
jgi:hypothetical protein